MCGDFGQENIESGTSCTTHIDLRYFKSFCLRPHRQVGRVGDSIEDDGGRSIDGKGVDGVAHRNRDEQVEGGADYWRETFALVSDKKGNSLVGNQCLG